VSQLEQAQQQYQQYKDGLDQGLNQQVISAEAALRTADGQYTEAQATFEAKTRERATGSEAQIREQGTAVENSRTQVVSAALEALRSGVTAVDTLAGSEPEAGQPGPAAENGAGAAGAVIGTADSVNRLHGAAQTLTQSQQSYEATLEKVDQDLAAQQRAVGRHSRRGRRRPSPSKRRGWRRISSWPPTPAPSTRPTAVPRRRSRPLPRAAASCRSTSPPAMCGPR